MKKIRFAALAAVAGENLSNSQLAIMRLQDSVKDGKIQAAAARRAFLPLWNAFVIDANRYNRILSGWADYDQQSRKDSRYCKCDIINYVSEFYNWFMC